MPSILSVTEARRTKVWWKSGPQCYYLYLWSIKKYFSHYRVSQKWSKFWPFFLHFRKFVSFCPQYWASRRPEEQNYGGNQTPSVTIYIFGVLENIFFITGCPKNGLNFYLFFIIFWNCHFLTSILSVNEARRTKVRWKSGPQCYYLYLWSIKEYFFHYSVSQKWSKFWPIFLHFLKF